MCGISGRLSFRNAPIPDIQHVNCMMGALTHRGPDDEGLYRDGPVALGHRRLSIIDLTTGGQPLSNEDETVWVVFNGEIYNFRDLRADLEARGHTFRTVTDTEVIVHLYEDYGHACTERLNGIFAFALWDSRRRKLLVARDPYGVKPLYYARTGVSLTFASELKALLCDQDVPREIDFTSLDWFLTYRFVPSPRTMLAAVNKLPPGHLIIADPDGMSICRYASPPERELLQVTEAEAVDLVCHGFETAVARQMVSDVPIGAFLSGGVDSAAIVASMARHSKLVRTYTVGFQEGGEYNELVEARQTARLFGTEHHELIVSAEQCAELLPKVTWHLDEPISTSSAVPLYFVAELAHRDVKVVLAGQGADEPFAGYTRYVGERYRAHWGTLPAPARWVARRAVDALPRSESLKRGVRSLAISNPAERFRQIYAVFPDDLKERLLHADVRSRRVEPSITPVEYWLAGLQNPEPLAQMQAVDIRLSLADDLLLYGDKMTMAHSIEMRVPFLDVAFMRLVEGLPVNLKLRGLTGKYVWKRAARRWLPSDIVNRPKRGFATPIDQWFRGALNPFVRDTLLGSPAATRGYFDQKIVERLIREHEEGRHDRRRQLFSLLALELWHRQFVDAGRCMVHTDDAGVASACSG